MISDFSSFVEFFAAIYVTMAVNNDFCSNFWTPKYYEEMKSLLNVYIITAKRKACGIKNEMRFSDGKTKCAIKKHPSNETWMLFC